MVAVIIDDVEHIHSFSVHKEVVRLQVQTG